MNRRRDLSLLKKTSGKKPSGQILIEGIFLLILFFGFVISAFYLENQTKELIDRNRLTDAKKKREKARRRDFSRRLRSYRL